MATYIGPKGYSILKERLSITEQESIRNDLKVTPFIPKSSMAKPSPFPIYRESKNKFYVPRFYGMKTYGDPKYIKINTGNPVQLQFNGTLREHQIPAVQKYLACAKKKGCGLLELYCGAGKTVCTLKIIADLGVKTLIIVHKTFLMNQWEERIREFLPTARVGKIQAEIIDIGNKDIVLGMLQSLSMKEYPLTLFQSFGLTVIDEVHHISAEVFSRALFKVVTPYMLGLSATMKRKDGLTKVFKMFLGDIVYKKAREGTDKVLVKAIHYEHNDAKYKKEHYNFRGHINYAIMIKQLCEFQPRTDFIIQCIQDTLKENSDQQIMVLGHNKSILTYMHNCIKKLNFATVGYYIGGMKERDLKISESKQIIIATYKMAEEGLDIKTLTTLIMVTPKTDVCQAVGRILRKKLKEHLIMDIIDQHPVFKRQWIKRRRYYKKQNYTIMETELNNYHKGEWKITYQKGSKDIKKKVKHKLQTGQCLINDDD